MSHALCEGDHVTMAAPPDRFHPDLLAGCDEPVRRFFAHAVRTGAPLAGTRLTMAGRIKVGAWLPFVAEQTADGRSFSWRARVGWGPIRPLRVDDEYADGVGRTAGRLFGRLRLFAAQDDDTARSAAGRAALESVAFAPASVLPQAGVAWRAEADDLVVARFDLPPEQPEVRVGIDEVGAVRAVSALRWGKAGGTYEYVPCGSLVSAERDFGDLVLPSELEVGWWFGTPRYAPFFTARVERVTHA